MSKSALDKLGPLPRKRVWTVAALEDEIDTILEVAKRCGTNEMQSVWLFLSDLVPDRWFTIFAHTNLVRSNDDYQAWAACLRQGLVPIGFAVGTTRATRVCVLPEIPAECHEVVRGLLADMYEQVRDQAQLSRPD
ncbi:MAG TPA: hypothetical protein VNO32_14520 [Candidatus Acidoferrum sp.]|jgi:hypothetical protein|nr:hypothetical protein [Candidatus Acidoferrum sp.]